MAFFKDMLTSGSGVSSKRFTDIIVLFFLLLVETILVLKKTGISNYGMCKDVLDLIFYYWMINKGLIGFEKPISKIGIKNILTGQADVKESEAKIEEAKS